MRARTKRRLDDAIILAWQAERFARVGKSLKGLGHYLNEVRPKRRQTAAEMLANFRALQGMGAPISIRRVARPI